MKIALIDSCPLSVQLYSHIILSAGAKVDSFSDPLKLISKQSSHYDLIISDFYFEKTKLDFFLDYISKDKLIIISGVLIEKEIDCLAVYMKNSVHTKRNILSLIKTIRPSLQLAHP